MPGGLYARLYHAFLVSVMVQCGRLSWLLSAFGRTINISLSHRIVSRTCACAETTYMPTTGPQVTTAGTGQPSGQSAAAKTTTTTTTTTTPASPASGEYIYSTSGKHSSTVQLSCGFMCNYCMQQACNNCTWNHGVTHRRVLTFFHTGAVRRGAAPCRAGSGVKEPLGQRYDCSVTYSQAGQSFWTFLK